MTDPLAIASLVVAALTLLVGTAVSVVVYQLGRRLDFRSRMKRWDELRTTTNKLTVGWDTSLRDVVLINARRYEKDYDGGYNVNRHGGLQEKVELLGARHNGVEVVCGVDNVWIDSRGKRTLKRTPIQTENALRVGFIPFEYVEHINADGDEYRGAPIFYVRHRGPGTSPFRHYTFVEAHGRSFGPSGRLYFAPITELGELRLGWISGWFRFNIGRVRYWWFERKNARLLRDAGLDRPA